MTFTNNIQLFTTTLFLLSSSSWSCHSCDGQDTPPPPSLIKVQPVMHPAMFDSILFTDLSEELNKSNSTAVYYDSTHDFWEKKPTKRGKGRPPDDKQTPRHDCSMSTSNRMETFIACSSLPNMSGYARKKDLMNKLSSASERIFMDDVIYNAQDQTCFFLSMSWQRAKSLYRYRADVSISNFADVRAKQEEEKDTMADVIILQPMLPMMKIGLGTVAKAVEIMTMMMTSSGTTTSVSILAQLSPAFVENNKTLGNDIQYMDVIHDIQHRSKELCQEDLLRALPYTGSIYSCPGGDELEVLPIRVDDHEQQDDRRDVVRFTIDVGSEGLGNSTIVMQAILAIVTGLASYTYFDFLEIEEGQEYFYYST